jgi:hypothetical protein
LRMRIGLKTGIVMSISIFCGSGAIVTIWTLSPRELFRAATWRFMSFAQKLANVSNSRSSSVLIAQQIQ